MFERLAYVLISVAKFYFVADINECTINDGNCSCSGINPCTAMCNNTVGSFECLCNDGYILDIDGLTCIGN